MIQVSELRQVAQVFPGARIIDDSPLACLSNALRFRDAGRRLIIDGQQVAFQRNGYLYGGYWETASQDIAEKLASIGCLVALI